MAQYASRDDIDELRLQMAQAIFGGLPDSEPIRHWTQDLAPLADAFGPRDRQDEERGSQVERGTRLAQRDAGDQSTAAVGPDAECRAAARPGRVVGAAITAWACGRIARPSRSYRRMDGSGIRQRTARLLARKPAEVSADVSGVAAVRTGALGRPGGRSGDRRLRADERPARPDAVRAPAGHAEFDRRPRRRCSIRPRSAAASRRLRISARQLLHRSAMATGRSACGFPRSVGCPKPMYRAHVDARLAAYRNATDRATKNEALDRALDAAYAWRVQGGRADPFQRIADAVAVAGDDQDALTVRVMRKRADAIVGTGIFGNIRSFNDNGGEFRCEIARAAARHHPGSGQRLRDHLARLVGVRARRPHRGWHDRAGCFQAGHVGARLWPRAAGCSLRPRAAAGSSAGTTSVPPWRG